MRFSNLMVVVSTVALAAVPAVAHAADATGAAGAAGLPSAVTWAAGIAGFLGFMLGSFPPNDRDAGVKWDMGGAMVWGLAAAAAVGGLAFFLTSGAMFPALYAVGFGALLAVTRVLSTRPPRVPKNCDAKNGVTRFEGDSPKAKFKAARKLYHSASFQRNGYYATRGREWTCPAGASAELLQMLGESCQRAYSDTFAILLFLVEELPGEPGEPAVVVVDTIKGLSEVKTTANGITVPGYDKEIPASAIRAMTGYAWR